MLPALLLLTSAWADPPPCQPPLMGQGLAATALQALPYHVDEHEFIGGYPGLGEVPVHPRILLVELKPTTTVAEANGFLCSQGAFVRGIRPGHPEVSGGVLAIEVPATSLPDLATRLGSVRQNPHVRRAIVDTLLSTTQLPFREGPSATPFGWQTWPLAGGVGNWGMIAIRAPEMWNLAEAMIKDDLRSTVGIVDSGFGEVDDITYMTRLDPEEGAHGTHVAGIIAATWGNNDHVDGVHPTADLVVTPLVGSIDGSCTDVYCNRESGGELIITNLESLLAADASMRVINLSLAFNWYSYGIDADTDPDAQAVADTTGDLFIASVESGVANSDYERPVFVACAGNDRGATATNASPFTSAALRDGYAPVIVVEALETTSTPSDPDYPYTLAWFSNSGGHLAAPGTDILSLSTNTMTILGVTYNLEYMSGTSMAAPHVTGLVGALYALHPDLPRPTATTNDVDVVGG
ncbi:MAG TPA: S8 family serine peptidase, partial [Myxococcota bacterium]|nr:S8 family serine peptidase [Myxococcota bacterium]